MNKPDIRFNGFNEEWLEKTFEDLVDVQSGRDYKHLSEGTIPVYGTGGYMLSVDEALSYNEDAVGIGRKGTIDKPYILKAPFWTVDTLFYSIPKNKMNLDFIFSAFQTIRWKDKDESTGVPSLSKNAINSTEIKIPNESAEQKKLGALFSQIDSLIASTQKEHDKLVSLKKCMLQKMFPKKGSLVPEIRFEGFSGDWVEKKLEILTFKSGVKNKDNLPYESFSITAEYGFIPQDEQFENGGTMATADKSMYIIVSKNSFGYNPARINVGSIGLYTGDKDIIVSSLYEIFQTTEDLENTFLLQWIKTDFFKKSIEQLQEGGVRLYFYYDKFCMSKIKIPSLPEQQKIGSYFQNLDNLISKQSAELEKLKNVKKTLLSKMFV